MHTTAVTSFGVLVLLIYLSVWSVECSLLGHHHQHNHEDNSRDGSIKSGLLSTTDGTKERRLMRVKTGGKQFKLTILKGSNNGASAPDSGRNRRPNRGKNGRKRRPKKIRGSRSQNLANKRPFPFRIPKTGFTCKGRAPGYYADVEADCQVYRMCMSRGAGGQAFLCPEGTKFNQRTLVCDHARRVKCSEASSFFHRNLIIHEASMKVDRRNSSKKKTANKEQQEKVLLKRPRLGQSSTPIIKVNLESKVIKTQAMNGKLKFAPLFETKRKQALEKFAKALKFDTPPSAKPTKATLFTGRRIKPTQQQQEQALGLNDSVEEELRTEKDEKLQLLPPKAAGKAVAKFRQDPEQPAALALSLVPPPQQTAVREDQVLQLVGHVMSPNDLSNIPDSPIFNINKAAAISNGKVRTGPAAAGRPPAAGSPRQQGGRSASAPAAPAELPRSPRVIGLPFQLSHLTAADKARSLPAPLVWISPASLARSPMVSLRHLDDSERALTMTFPGRPKNRFSRRCLECMSLRGTASSDQCSMCFLF